MKFGQHFLQGFIGRGGDYVRHRITVGILFAADVKKAGVAKTQLARRASIAPSRVTCRITCR